MLKKQATWWLIILFLIGAYVAWALLRPLPDLKPATTNISLRANTGASSLAWPNNQTALGIVDTGFLQTHGPQKPLPTASTAKLITALMVLKKKPLDLGQSGPLITMSAHDQAIYQAYTAKDGSVVPVVAGEKISEYQALEAMLLPSANNMADSLAIWAYGSLPAYSSAANAYIKQLGLSGTTVGPDASGFNPATLSTARDLTSIGELVMQSPILANIVGEQQASGIPDAGTIKNVNFLLGSDGIIGVKTGNTDQAGGVYVAAARAAADSKPVTIVTTIMDAPNLFDALKSSLPLIQSADKNFQSIAVVKAGQALGYYPMPWGGSIPVLAPQNLQITAWKGLYIKISAILPTISLSTHSSQKLTELTARDPATGYTKSISLILGGAPSKPPLTWRLSHPF